MDNPKKLSESGASQPPDPDAGQGFGATGIFAAMSEPESPNPPSMGIEPWPELEKAQKPEPPVRGQEMGATALVEPVVHRVVLPQGNDAPSNDLIDRIRNAAAEREPDQAKAPLIGAQGSQPAMRNAAPGAEGGDAGFTQLLRSMGLESQAPQAPAKPAPAMAPQRSASTDGFTAMLSAFKSPAGTMPAGATPAGSVSAADQHSGAGFAPAPAASEPRPAEPQSQDRPGFTQQFSGAVGESRTFRAVPGQSATPPPVAPPPASRPNPPAPPASQPGEFTRLFNSMSGAASEPPANRSTPSPAPAAEPGAFTQLFNSFGGAASGPSELQASRSTPGPAPAAQPGGFTRMFQSAAPSTPAGSGFHEDLKPQADTGRFDMSQFAAPQTPSIHEPVVRRQTEDLPFADVAQSGPRDSVTQLLRRLDSPAPTPASQPTAPPPPPPVNPASRAGSGGLTDIFASLDQSADSGANTGAPADRPAYQVPQAAGGPPPWTGASAATEMNQRPTPAAPTPPASSGPSEFTRILDASRIREMALRGEQGVSAPSVSAAPAPAPAASAMPAAPQMQVPGYPMPAAPHLGAMPGAAPGAHPGGVPPRMPGYPMSPGAHAGAMPAAGAGMPHIPGAHVPAIAAPAVPKPPAVAPPPGGMGKLQQYVPLLLILIIFLLVGVLVTVVFLLKH